MRLTRRGEVVLAVFMFAASTVVGAFLLYWALGRCYLR